MRIHRRLTRFTNSLFGFLLGSTLAGASVYYYILEEYKVSNELLTEDIYVRLPLSHEYLSTYTNTKIHRLYKQLSSASTHTSPSSRTR
jgi:hypothetical protein